MGHLVITLIVKDGDNAKDVAIRKLNDWYLEGKRDVPYAFPPGALLSYSIHEDE